MRWFWGLRLYLVCAPSGMPVLRALADPKIGEREVLAAMLEVDAEPVRQRRGLLLITDKGLASKTFEQSLSADGITLPLSVSSTAAHWPASPIRLRTVFGSFCTSTPLIRARPVSGPAR